MLKSCGWVGWCGGVVQDFSVSSSPLGTDWDLGLTGLGLGWVRGQACQYAHILRQSFQNEIYKQWYNTEPKF